MKPDEYKRIIAHFGFSQEEAARWLGVSGRTGNNYAIKGPTTPVAKLLRMMIRLKLKPEELR